MTLATASDPPIDDGEHDPVSELIADFFLRELMGETPRVQEYEERAGRHYERFVRAVERMQAVDASSWAGRRATAIPPSQQPERRFGAYQILQMIGEGAYGRVYRAHQVNLSRPVALKLLHRQSLEQDDLQERFHAGASAAAQVEHDHVVRIFEHGIHEGRPFIAMSLLPGPSWRAVIQRLCDEAPGDWEARHGILDEVGVTPMGTGPTAFAQRIASAFAGVAEALARYHHLGIVHRDVKPGNLLLDGQGRVVLTDFDLAKSALGTSETQYGDVLGTPAYMSPEQWRGDLDAIDGRADLYGLGILLYETLANQRPYSDARLIEQVRGAALRGTPPRLHTVAPDTPRALCRIVHKTIERDPEDRYTTGTELAEDLRRFARGDEVDVPGSWHRKTLRWARRYWWAVAPAATLVLAVAVWSLWFRAARLHVLDDQMPGGEVFVDGTPRGGLPLRDAAVDPGTRSVTWKHEFFEPWTTDVELTSGSERTVTPRQVVRADAPPAFLAYFETLRAFREGITPTPTQRTGRDGIAWLPRGTVTRGDLDRLYVRLEEGVFGTVSLQDASGRELDGSRRIVKGTDAPLVAAPLSREVRERLVAGQTYTWQVRSEDDKLLDAAPVTVVDTPSPDEIEATLAVLRRGASDPDTVLTAVVARMNARHSAAALTLMRGGTEVSGDDLGAFLLATSLSELGLYERDDDGALRLDAVAKWLEGDA